MNALYYIVSQNSSHLLTVCIRGTVLSWLQSFLCGRTHRTRIDGVVSDVAQIISGVVQGSGVGPVMFLAYINELIYILEGFDIKVKNVRR